MNGGETVFPFFGANGWVLRRVSAHNALCVRYIFPCTETHSSYTWDDWGKKQRHRQIMLTSCSAPPLPPDHKYANESQKHVTLSPSLCVSVCYRCASRAILRISWSGKIWPFAWYVNFIYALLELMRIRPTELLWQWVQTKCVTWSNVDGLPFSRHLIRSFPSTVCATRIWMKFAHQHTHTRRPYVRWEKHTMTEHTLNTRTFVTTRHLSWCSSIVPIHLAGK